MTAFKVSDISPLRGFFPEMSDREIMIFYPWAMGAPVDCIAIDLNITISDIYFCLKDLKARYDVEYFSGLRRILFFRRDVLLMDVLHKFEKLGIGSN